MEGLWSFFKRAAGKTAAHLLKGDRGEDEAARYLKRQGYRILCRQFRGKHGEIDLVARDGEVLAFVEVKTRSSDRFGAASSAVNHEKQLHLSSCASEYMRLLGNPRIPVRFDVVEVYLPDETGEPTEIRLIQSAFTSNSQFHT